MKIAASPPAEVPVEHTYLDLGFGYAEGTVEEDHFALLKDQFATCSKESALIDEALLRKEKVANDLQGFRPLYDAIHFTSSFVKDLTSYRS